LIYFFENHSLDTDRRELRRGGQIIAIGPQVFDVLEYLVRNRERVVSNDDLIEGYGRGGLSLSRRSAAESPQLAKPLATAASSRTSFAPYPAKAFVSSLKFVRSGDVVTVPASRRQENINDRKARRRRTSNRR
jgi:hypothetical protein